MREPEEPPSATRRSGWLLSAPRALMPRATLASLKTVRWPDRRTECARLAARPPPSPPARELPSGVDAARKIPLRGSRTDLAAVHDPPGGGPPPSSPCGAPGGSPVPISRSAPTMGTPSGRMTLRPHGWRDPSAPRFRSLGVDTDRPNPCPRMTLRPLGPGASSGLPVSVTQTARSDAECSEGSRRRSSYRSRRSAAYLLVAASGERVTNGSGVGRGVTPREEARDTSAGPRRPSRPR